VGCRQAAQGILRPVRNTEDPLKIGGCSRYELMEGGLFESPDGHGVQEMENGMVAARRVRLPSRRVNWMLFGISLVIAVAGVLLQQAPG